MIHIACGDCLDVMRGLQPDSINLIMTSPPYADRRKKQYGGSTADKYVDWFIPRAAEMMRILEPKGSLIINIKEHVIDGERSEYVMDLVKAMRRHGWRWVEEYIWRKKNCNPGKWPNRFRDAWEHCFHFTTQRQFAMYQDAVMVPIGDWATTRLTNLHANDMVRHEATNKSGFGRNVSNWLGRDMVYPANVLDWPGQTTNVDHPAAFPSAMPDFFIRLFTKPGDTVLDPFCGSGTTLLAAAKLGRLYRGIDISQEYCNTAYRRIAEVQQVMEASA